MSNRDSLRNRRSNTRPGLERLEDRTTPASGSGLLAQYYENPDLTSLAAVRTDPGVSGQWASGIEPAAVVAGGGYSVRWSGQVEAQYTEDYTFTATADEKVRVWVNGELLVNGSGGEAAAEYSGTIRLVAGRRYDLQVEYENHLGAGQVRLEWASGSQPRQVIPAGQLFPSERGGLLHEGQGLSGFVYPPITGYYRFTLGALVTGTLYLSNSTDSTGKQLIAAVPNNSLSAPVYLVAGQGYYVEASQTGGTGSDAPTIGWVRPDGRTDAVVPGDYLAPVLPEIRVYADTAAAVEGEASQGQFTVVRTGPTSTPVTVYYTVGGTATPGTDYAPLSGSVTIPAGQTSAVITVTGLADALLEGTETVSIELQDGPGYQVGTVSSRTASTTVLDNIDAPAGGTAVVDPALTKFSVTGAQYGNSQIVSDPRFGQALQVNVAAVPPNTYNLQVFQATTAAVRQGDRLLLEFYARVVNGDSGQIQAIFEQNGGAFTKYLSQGAQLSGEWAKFQMPFVVGSDYAIGAADFNFRMGFQLQSIQLAGIRVLNYGPSPSLIPDAGFTVNETGGDWGSAQTVSVSGPGFTSATQFTTTARPPSGSFQFQEFAKNAAALAAGETVTVEYYVRSVGGAAANVRAVVQTAGGGTIYASRDDTFGTDWTRCTITFTTAQAFAANAMQLGFNFGFDPQTVQIGGIKWTHSGPTTPTTTPAVPTSSTGALTLTGSSFGNAQLVDATGPTFSRAFQVATTTRPTNNFNFQVTTRSDDAITAGTVVTIQFYIRAVGASGTAKYAVTLQNANNNFFGFFNTGDLTVGTGWALVTRTATVTQDVAARGLQFAINLGYDPQTVQIGGLQITSAADPALFQSDILSELRFTGAGTYGTATLSSFTSAPGFFQSYTVTTTTKPTNPYDIQAIAKTSQAVAAGDTLTLQFYARSTSGTAPAINAVVQQSAGSFTTLSFQKVSLTGTWTLYTVTVPIAQAFAAGALQVAFDFGYGVQTAQIIGVTLTKTSPPVPLVNTLPSLSTPIGYGGREGTADWRAQADAQIDEVRKADLTVQVVDQAGRAVDGAVVYARQTEQAFKFGTAVNASLLNGTGASADKYRAMLLQLFNTATIENDLKWPQYAAGPQVGRTAADWLVANGLYLRAHNVIWPSRSHMPTDVWATYDQVKASQGADAAAAYLKAAIQQRIADAGSALAGLAGDWDVMNEPFANHDVMDVLGDEVVTEWFQALRDYDPAALRFLNDYDIFSRNGLNSSHRADFDAWIAQLTAAGVLDGIGEQSHYTTGNLTDIPVFDRLLDTYGAYGLPIAITEFDFTTTDRQLQADYLRDYMTMAFSNPAVAEFVQWGFWAGSHYSPDAALFNSDWSIRPNGQAYEDLVFGDWWTDTRGTSAWGGTFSTRAFQGDYQVMVEYNGQTLLVPATLGPDGVTLTVSVVAPPVAETPTVTAPATATGGEGAPIPLGIAAHLNDLDSSEVLTITISGVPAGAKLSAGTNLGGGVWTLTPDQLNGLAITVPDNLPGDAPFTLTVTATATEPSDGDAATASAAIAVTVQNVAPTPAIQSISIPQVEGTAITVTGTAFDPAGANDSVTRTWAVYKDGASVAYATGSGASFTFTPGDNGSYRVVLTASDEDGGTASTEQVVAVANVAPAPSLGGPTSAVRGQTLTYTGSFTDPGVSDTHALAWKVTRSGATYATGTGSTFSFVPTDNGTYQVSFTVTDDDGGTATAASTVAVSVMAVQEDPLNPGKGLLTIGGTTGDDTIVVSPASRGAFLVTILSTGPGWGSDLTVGLFRPQSNGWSLDLTLGGSTITIFSASITLPLDGIVVYGQAGDDTITVAGGIDLTAWLYGGAGDDTLKGGGGDSVLIGGDGNDQLTGGKGRDILIGGRGADRLVAGADDDILIAGTTAYDDDREALAGLLGVWVDRTKTYQQRATALADPSLRDGVYLGSATVLNDTSADLLTGNSGSNWFFFDPPRDRATDVRKDNDHGRPGH